MSTAPTEDDRSQLLAQLSAALRERTAVQHALDTWSAAVRARLGPHAEVGLALTCADGRTVQVATHDAAAAPGVRHESVAGPAAPPSPGSSSWRTAPAPEPFAAGVLLGGPVAGGGSLLVVLLSREPTDWRDGPGAAVRGMVDDLRAVVGLAVGLEQAALSMHDVDAMLRSRAVIDQAVGVVMAHHGCGAEQAMQRLRRASQRSGVSVARLAARLVTDVSGGPPAAPAGFRVRRAPTG